MGASARRPGRRFVPDDGYALSEARQQAGVLKNLLVAIERKREGIPVNPDDDLAGFY